MSESHSVRLYLFCFAILALPATGITAQPADPTPDGRLRELYTAEWNWRQKEMARRGNEPGDAGADDHFPRVDAASQQTRLAYWTRALANLDSIPFNRLSPDEQINADVFRTSLRALANDVRFRAYEAPFNSDSFFWTDFTPSQGFANADIYRNYLGRLRDVPRYFNEQSVNMRAGLGRGFTVPRVSVVGRDKTIEPYTKGDSTNPLYTPFRASCCRIRPMCRRRPIGNWPKPLAPSRDDATAFAPCLMHSHPSTRAAAEAWSRAS